MERNAARRSVFSRGQFGFWGKFGCFRVLRKRRRACRCEQQDTRVDCICPDAVRRCRGCDVARGARTSACSATFAGKLPHAPAAHPRSPGLPPRAWNVVHTPYINAAGCRARCGLRLVRAVAGPSKDFSRRCALLLLTSAPLAPLAVCLRPGHYPKNVLRGCGGGISGNWAK